MDITGSYALPCSPEAAWAALNDPEALKAALTGCERLERTSPVTFIGTVATRIGPVSARFSGKMAQSEIDPPRGCIMTFEGQGGAAGFVKGRANVTLTAEGDGVRLTYVAETQIGGKLAQIGARLVEGAARSMADDFFGKFAQGLAPTPVDTVGPQVQDRRHSRAGGVTGWLVVAGAVLLLAMLAYRLFA